VLRKQRLRDRAAAAAEKSSSTFFTVIGVMALAIAVGVALPAEAKKRQGSQKPAQEPIADPANGEPMILVVSLASQKVDVYRGTTLITSSAVSTGMPAHATKAGVFSILEKQRTHHSNIYSGAPMPWMNRITWSGTALHAGVVPGYPASHGCIRLPFSFAPKLFKITTKGDNVVVARERLAPQLIEHPALFQPLPPPPAPVLVKQDQPPQRQSSNESAPVLQPKPTHPGMLARADLAGSTTDIPSSLEAEAAKQEAAPIKVEDPATVEDTHVHAFDPFVGGQAPSPEAAKASQHALDEDNDTSRASVAAAPDRPVKAAERKLPKAETARLMPESAAPLSAAAVAETPAAAVEPAQAQAEISVPTADVPTPEQASIEAKTPKSEPSTVVAEAVPTAPVETSPTVPMPAEAPVAAPDTSPVETALPVSDAPPSEVAAKLDAGAKAVAVLAAEPRSTAPLRILVTRRTQRDRIIGVQQILANMGYLMTQDFDGTLGKESVTAIKTFQRNNGMPETGAFSDELVNKVYAVAGKGEPPVGHLFVRQEFGRVFDAPISFRDPQTPLGTHLFTALNFEPGATSTRWVALSLQGDNASSALDRLEIPNDVRKRISERLTPGSSLIIGDTAINTATLPKGGDFLVWAKDTPAKITTVSADGDNSIAKPRKKKPRTVRRSYSNSYGANYPRPFTRGYSPWPW
jgi:peptidoglycan hydrolase-like protein with peptidoglycan-binding domain